MRLIRILLMVVVAVVIGLVVLVVALPGEKIAKIAADQVKAQTGRDLVFKGDVGISWYPVFGVSTGPVSLSNADWSDAGPMFSAESAAIGVDVMAALGGNIRITKIEAARPEVLLELAKDGRANWELFPTSSDGEQPETTETASGFGAITLEHLLISDAKLRYVDHGGDSFELAKLDVDLRWPDISGPADIALTLRPAKDDVSISGQVADLQGLLEGRVSNVTLNLATAGGKVSFDGRSSITPEIAGNLTIDAPNPDAVMAALGLDATGLAGPVGLEGAITLTKAGQISLRKGVVRALGNTVSVQADLETSGTRPKVTAQIAAGKLDLSAFGGASEGETSTAAADSGWSKAAIDASGLSAVDGEVLLVADAIDLGNLKLGKSRMVATIDNARAVFSLREIQAYEGIITGEFVANNRNGLSVGGKMSAKGLELKTLLADTMDLSRFSGKVTTDVAFLGVGQSVHAIMNSLKGNGSVDVGQGTISGLDLDRLLRGMPGGGTTVFDSLTGTMVIEKGVMTNQDLLLSLPSVLAKGDGWVGLGARNLDYLFTPQIRRSDEQGLAVPIRIKGSWDDPSIRPELDKALGVDLDAEKEKLKDKADEKLKKELGIQDQEGVSSEEAVKDSLEDAAKKELLKILGGN